MLRLLSLVPIFCYMKRITAVKIHNINSEVVRDEEKRLKTNKSLTNFAHFWNLRHNQNLFFYFVIQYKQ